MRLLVVPRHNCRILPCRMPRHDANADTIDPLFLTCATVTLCLTHSVKSNRSHLTHVLRARNRFCFDAMYMNNLTRIIYNAKAKTRRHPSYADLRLRRVPGGDVVVRTLHLTSVGVR